MTGPSQKTSPPLDDQRDAGARVISMGCRLNLAEGAAIERLTQDVDDTVVINSCAVTNEAVRQTRQTIRRARRENPDAQIVVTGCAAQVEPAAFAAMDEVTHVIGNVEKLTPSVWNALQKARGGQVKVNDIMSVRETADHMIDGYGERARAFLQIQNGCNHRCTFCIIPYGRGNARSASINEVIDQARRLINNGHHELVLTGVDITSWGEDLEGAPVLGDLVSSLLDELPDLFRLRLSSIDGAEIDTKLRERIINDDRVAPHIHLSVQSGDDLILKRMKRRHCRDDIIRLCHDLRAERPDIAFGADVIAGFPTETEEMFENSARLVEEAGLNYLHIFPFSPREGTPAARMPQLDRREIKRRAEVLRGLGEKATAAFLDGLIGQTAIGVRESGGRARLGNFAQVVFDGGAPGDLVTVKIRARDGLILRGAPA